MSALEKLGASLTNAVRKLLRSSVVDEATVKELIRDFQRALLQADVNVQLVLNLSQQIEKRTLEEKLPPGISRREHVVTVIYGELTKFLGEKPVHIHVEAGTPNVFMLVGIQGSGKCVIGDTEVTLSTGFTASIDKLFEEQMKSCETLIVLKDGLIIEPRDVNVFSVNIGTLTIEETRVNLIWKLKAPKELIETQLAYDYKLKLTTTPEHPYFTLKNETIELVRADKLTPGQLVMIPSGINVHKGSDTIGTTSSSQQCLAHRLLPLLKGDVCWVKVVKTKRIKDHAHQYVYDLTVQEHHNFVANDVIVHNTTSAAKLAKYFQKRGYKTALVCADTFRLGAYDQLKQLADINKIPFYGDLKEKHSLSIALEGVGKYRQEKVEVIILDTAGRHKDEVNLIKEMEEIAEKIEPNEVILVIDATIGQQASIQAKAFHDSTNIGSILLTKLDSSARGGGALSAVAVTKVPIKFIGVGERVEDIEPFIPSRFVGRLLGMGDIEGLVKRVREAEVEVPEKKAKAILRGKFSLMDMYEQMEAVSSMGPLKRVLNMIPGMSYNIPEDALEVAEERIKKWKYIIQSMTKDEKENPKILNSSRIRRVARGSGTSEKEVKEVIKQYNTTRKLMRSMGKRKIPPFMRKMLGQMR